MAWRCKPQTKVFKECLPERHVGSRRRSQVHCTLCWAALSFIRLECLLINFIKLAFRGDFGFDKLSAPSSCAFPVSYGHKIPHVYLLFVMGEAAQRRALVDWGGCRFTVRFARARQLSSARNVGLRTIFTDPRVIYKMDWRLKRIATTLRAENFVTRECVFVTTINRTVSTKINFSKIYVVNIAVTRTILTTL